MGIRRRTPAMRTWFLLVQIVPDQERSAHFAPACAARIHVRGGTRVAPVSARVFSGALAQQILLRQKMLSAASACNCNVRVFNVSKLMTLWFEHSWECALKSP